MFNRLVFALQLSLIVTACGNSAPTNANVAQAPASWLRECPGEAFCFSRPSDLTALPLQAIDSLAKRYQSDTLTLSFDMGRYGTSVAHLANFPRVPMTVGGRAGEMLVGDQEIVLLIPKVHDSAVGPIKFAMTLKFKTPSASQELARQVFQSIEFMPQR